MIEMQVAKRNVVDIGCQLMVVAEVVTDEQALYFAARIVELMKELSVEVDEILKAGRSGLEKKL